MLATIARRPVRVRWHLVVLVLGAIAPLLALAVVGVRRDLREQRQILERGMQQVARALSVAADREVRTSFAILETLAASPALASGDLRAFHELCVRAIAARKDSWIILFDRSGQQVLNTSRPFGSPLPNPLRQAQPPAADPRYPILPLGGAAPVAAVLETAQPVTSDLFVALDSRRPTIGIAIPVMRDGAVAYVLEMSVDPDLLLRLLMDQRPPPDSVVTLVDRRDVIIARTLDQPRRVGSPMAPDLAAQITRKSDGLDLGHTAEGLRVYHIFTRSRLTGWAVSVAVSESVIAAPMTRSIVVLSGGVAAALLIGLGAAFLLGKRISGPLSVLAGAADAMARGERIELRRSALREVEDLHGALVAAGAAVRSAASEREQRLVAETKREEAQAANRAKDEFLAMLSHELRTPINAVFGWSRMLQSGQVPEGGRARALDAIVRNANAQVQLIDDLLDVSRVISGKMRLDVRPVDVRVVVEAAVDAVRPAADAKAIRLETTLDPGAGPLRGDPDRLQQVVWNLLTNAVKFTPKGGRVQVHLQRVNSHVEIVVSDTGEGIPAELLPVIFDRFRQGGVEVRQRHGGLGLGLALVRHLVEAHGGTVAAHSAGENQGATFVVKLPVALAKLDDAMQARVHPTARAVLPVYISPVLDGVRVLVVDDEVDALDLATAILTAARADVRTCQSVAEALSTFRVWRPDVLVSDIEMRGDNGLELIRQIRAMDPSQGGRVPAVALTAYGRIEDRMRTLTAGFSMHVPKPVDPAELTTIVASLAGREMPREV